MWQIFTLTALVFNAAETATDKVIMVADRTLDTLVISFYRNQIFVVLAFLVGLSGLAGILQFRFEWMFILVAIFEIFNGIFYTILLKKSEMTAASAIGYATPFIFLLSDLFIFKTSLASLQIIGILLLVCGGILFVIDPYTRRLKNEYTTSVIWILFFKALIYGVEYYTFKYFAIGHGLNEISYIVNVWLWVGIGLFFIVLFTNRTGKLYQIATRNHYLLKITLSKTFDVGSSIFWFHALSLATVSQVNSLASFEPLILLSILLLVQQRFKLKTDEDFTPKSLSQKIAATGLLLAGAWLVS